MTPAEAQLFQQAVQMAQSGQTQQANNIFSQLLQQHPNNLDALLWLAFTSSDPQLARIAIDRAAQLSPGNPVVVQAQSWYNQRFAPSPPPQYYQSQANYYMPRPVQHFMDYRNQKLGFGDRFQLGWLFMKQSFQMAREEPGLMKPSFHSVALNLLIFIVLGIPLMFTAALTRNTLIYFAAFFVLMLVLYLVTHFFSSVTISLVYQKVTRGHADPKEAWHVTGNRIPQIIGVAAISAFVALLRSIARENNNNLVFSIVARLVTSIIDAIWTTYTYFVLPVIVIEDRNVADAVKRATHIIKNNLLQIGVGFVGLGLVTGLISFLIIIPTLLLSVGLFMAMYQVNMLVAIIAAGLLFFIVVSLLEAVSSYLRISYYTCLVIWARSVEAEGPYAYAPAPLRNVLNSKGYSA
jgi:membrane-anchored glycerophosphoryl diester phosphodiesterase (GDPDase)